MNRERRTEMFGALKKAKKILKGEKIEFVKIMKDYIGFKIFSKGVSMVVYPHKTSAGHFHARVRDENSKDKSEFLRLWKKLDEFENNCEFHLKSK